MTPAEVAAERLAIALEAGVPEARARELAECERVWATARVTRSAWRCQCGAHPSLAVEQKRSQEARERGGRYPRASEASRASEGHVGAAIGTCHAVPHTVLR